MKTITMILAVILCITTNASEVPTEGLTIGTSMGFTQRQVLPNGHILHHGTLARFSLDAEMHQSGIYAHVMTQKGIDSDYHGEEREVDAVLGMTKKFLDHYRFDTNIMYDHNTQDETENFVRLHLKVGWDTGESQRNFRISPYTSVTTFLCDEKSEHMGSGTVCSVGVDNIWKVSKRLNILLPLALSYDTGVAHADPGIVGMGSFGIQYKLSKHVSIETSYTGYLGDHKTTFWSTMMSYHW